MEPLDLGVMSVAVNPLAGRLPDRYRIARELGRGGMATVFLAEDQKHHRKVALKIMRPEVIASIGPERFLREIAVTARLDHPHILPLLDSGESEGVLYYVMPFVDGESLHTKLAREKQLQLDHALRITREVADALDYAHARGIVHRDIKPENILLAAGHARVADFGIARAMAAAGAEVLTETGLAVGTPAYMSPEQAAGEREVDGRTDVYALGCVLYEMLAGHPPFTGTTAQQIFARHAVDPVPPIRTVRESVPEVLQQIIATALAKTPADRFQTAGEFEAALSDMIVRPKSGPGRTASTATAPARAQEIRFCTTRDGVRLAYSVVGTGPFIVRVLGHFTHLEMEWEWPDLRRFWEELAKSHTVVRYDGRGMGLSDPYREDFTEETRQLDLDVVLTAVGAESAVLLGISEGGWTAATYAIQHPERITHLVLYGAYSRGAQARPGYDAEEDQALVTLIRKGWGRDTPRFRQVFTSQFFRSDADPNLIAYFNELQRASADPDTAARYHASVHRRGDGRDLFRQVKIPTLVVHCRDDMAVGAEEGRLLASIIPGAQLVLLPSGTHYFPTDPEVVTRVVGAITRFLHGPEVQSS
jgi:pimeloyl-ACP methyl ester carboxylesterase